MDGDKIWRLASVVFQLSTVFIAAAIICGVIAYFHSRQLLRQASATVSASDKRTGEVHHSGGVAACAGAPTPLQALCTPGGTQFMAFSTYEAHVLLHEMYHGSTDSRLQDCGMDSLLDGSAAESRPYIVDIGANIGLFSLWVKESFKNAHILAVEALPPTAAVLRCNLELAGARDVHVYQCGAGVGSTQLMQFEFTPGMSVGASSVAGKAVMEEATSAAGSDEKAAPAPGLLATLYDLTVDTRRTFLEVLSSAAAPGQAAPARVREVLNDSGAVKPEFAGSVPSDAACWWRVLSEVVPLMLVKSTHEVEIKATSSILQQHEAEVLGGKQPVIDYLKIDVEGAEELVLKGVTSRDWHRTRNVMVEVHDAGGALCRVASQLRDLGFRVSTKQEVWRIHKRLGIYLVFGTRDKSWEPPTWCSQL